MPLELRRALLLALFIGLPTAALLPCLGVPASEWQVLQRRWSELRRARGLAGDAPGLVSIARRSERCVICHLGGLHGYSVGGHPLFAPHPELRCTVKLREVGCSICHRGDAQRLDSSGAHGRAEGGRGLLALGQRGEQRLRTLQAACASCHRGSGRVLRYDAEVVPDVARGLELYLRQGCPACHQLPGVATSGELGSSLASSLLRLGADEIRERLLRPQAFWPGSSMPPLELAPDDRERLLVFLMAQAGTTTRSAATSKQAKSPGLADHFPADVPSEATPAAGAIWARRAGCPGCHRLGDEQSGVPDLRYVGWYARPDELRAMLLEPARRVPGTTMPPLRAPSPIPQSLLAWLALQRQPLPSEPSQVAKQICARCHGRSPDPKHVVLSRRAPILEGVAGSIPASRFIDAVTRGRPGTAMAPWGRVLPRSFIEQLRSALQEAR